MATASNNTSKAAERGRRGEAERSRDAISRYIHSLKDCTPISREREVELAKKAQDGDEQAFERLVKSNMRLVVKLANEYKGTRNRVLDLIQEGNVGLVKAVNKFDPERGVRLSSYAQYWIRAYILKFIMDNYNLIKLGTTQAQRKLFFNLKKAKAKLRKSGEEPTAKKVAESLNVDVETVEEVDLRMSGGEASIDAPIKGSDSLTIRDSLEDQQEMPTSRIDNLRATLHLKKRLQEYRDSLEGRDAKIWDERMCSDDPTTLRELGEGFGVSRERVRQLEMRIKKNLAMLLEREVDSEHLDALRHGKYAELL